MTRRSSLPCIVALLLAIPVLVCADRNLPDTGKPDGMGMVTGLSGFGVNEDGLLDPGGAISLNTPLGYTLSGGQTLTGGWLGAAGGSGGSLQLGLSVGLMAQRQGLSLTLNGTDTSYPLTGTVQKQFWSETGRWPALSVGMVDVSNERARSTFVAMTKRLSGLEGNPLKPVLRASSLAWPPGPSSPSMGNPATWGAIVLPESRAGLQPLGSSTEAAVPPAELAPPVDGVLGSEWQDAFQTKVDTADGQTLLVGLQRVGTTLYLVAAMPSEHRLVPGTRLDVCLEAPREADRILRAAHHRFSLEWGRDRDELLAYRAVPQGGQWRDEALTLDDQRPPRRLGGAISCEGDSGSRFPVFEMAIPLAELGVQGDGDRLGLGLWVTLPAISDMLHSEADLRDDVVAWPAAPLRAPGELDPVFASRPDLWGRVSFGARPGGTSRIWARPGGELPVVDGRLGPDEWEDADTRATAPRAGLTQTLRLKRVGDVLCLAVVSTAEVGVPREATVELYLDPLGDQGLLPRADDRCLRLGPGAGAPLEVCAWDAARRRWVATPASDFTAARGETLASGSVTEVAEFLLPLSALGLPAQPSPYKLAGLAVQTQLTSAAARLARQGSRREDASGESTFLTLAWGDGIYREKVLWSVSHPVGPARGVVEYDGDQINVGLSAAPFNSQRVRMTLGWNGIEGGGDGGPLLGMAFTSGF